MKKKRRTFKVPPWLEQTILDERGKPCGTLRLKPDSIGWRPRGKSVYLTVGIEQLEGWLKDPETKARALK